MHIVSWEIIVSDCGDPLSAVHRAIELLESGNHPCWGVRDIKTRNYYTVDLADPENPHTTDWRENIA